MVRPLSRPADSDEIRMAMEEHRSIFVLYFSILLGLAAVFTMVEAWPRVRRRLERVGCCGILRKKCRRKFQRGTLQTVPKKHR